MAPFFTNRKLYSYGKTVAVVFTHPGLAQAIQNWASAKGVDIFELEPESPDIIVAGHFAAVIDRTVLGLAIYDSYLCCVSDVNSSDPKSISNTDIETNFAEQRVEIASDLGLDEIHNTSSLIIVDKRRDLPYPELDFVAQIDPDAEFGIERILGVLEEAHHLEKRRESNE